MIGGSNLAQFVFAYFSLSGDRTEKQRRRRVSPSGVTWKRAKDRKGRKDRARPDAVAVGTPELSASRDLISAGIVRKVLTSYSENSL